MPKSKLGNKSVNIKNITPKANQVICMLILNCMKISCCSNYGVGETDSHLRVHDKVVANVKGWTPLWTNYCTKLDPYIVACQGQVQPTKRTIVMFFFSLFWYHTESHLCSRWPSQLLQLKTHHPTKQIQCTIPRDLGWSGGAMVLGKLPVPGRPANLDYSRARAYCACSGCGWGLFGHFFSRLSFLFSFSLSLGDGPI